MPPNDPPTGHRYECPICETAARRMPLYQHLQVDHRKSAISRVLLDEATDAESVRGVPQSDLDVGSGIVASRPS